MAGFKNKRTLFINFINLGIAFVFSVSANAKSIQASAFGFRFSAPESLCQKVVQETAPWQKMKGETDHPASLFPEHVYFRLAGPYYEFYEHVRQKNIFTFPPEIHFYAIEGFKEVFAPQPSYISKMLSDIERFKTLLSDKKPKPKYLQDTLFMAYPMGNVAQTFLARIHKIKFKSGEGLAFLTQLNLEPAVFRGDQLLYVFQGLSKDGKYIVTATFPVNPKKPLFKENYPEDVLKNQESFLKYLEQIELKLNAMSYRDFEPKIQELDNWVTSIEII